MNELPQSPHLDAAPAQIPADQTGAPPSQWDDLLMASRNYWAGQTGRENPPAPTVRRINGKLMLGRYMDAYGCQAHIRGTRNRWEQWYTGFFISCAIAIVLGPVDVFAMFIVIPLYALWYFSVKAKRRRQYDLYYAVQDQILQTGQPEWVPFDKERLELISKNPLAVWP